MSKDYELLHPVDFGPEEGLKPRGEVVSLSEEEAHPLIEAGVIRQAPSKFRANKVETKS